MIVIRASSYLSVFAINCLVLVNFLTVFQYGMGEVVKEKYDCSHMVLKQAKDGMKALSHCSKELKAKYATRQEYADNVACLLKCMFQREKMSNPDDHVTESSFVTTMTKYLPSELMVDEIRTKIFAPCGTEASQLDPSEENCKSYGRFALCVQGKTEELINTSEEEEKLMSSYLKTGHMNYKYEAWNILFEINTNLLVVDKV